MPGAVDLQRRPEGNTWEQRGRELVLGFADWRFILVLLDEGAGVYPGKIAKECGTRRKKKR